MNHAGKSMYHRKKSRISENRYACLSPADPIHFLIRRQPMRMRTSPEAQSSFHRRTLAGTRRLEALPTLFITIFLSKRIQDSFIAGAVKG